MRWFSIALVSLAVVTAVGFSATDAQARKRKPANNEICFDPALTAAERSDCKSQYSAAKTADERAKIHKEFKRKITIAKAAAQPHS